MKKTLFKKGKELDIAHFDLVKNSKGIHLMYHTKNPNMTPQETTDLKYDIFQIIQHIHINDISIL